MRNIIAAAFALALPVLAVASPQPARAQATLSVPIDQTVKVGFTGAARDVVVGNPAIADVTLLEAGGAIVLGKQFGVTSVTAFDAGGRTVFSRQVLVTSGDDNRVTFYRGTARNTLVCGSSCEAVGGEVRSAPSRP
ncbi:MAG: hypothetical protein BGN86_02335 [Caulobacterales bacterium 68-7]|nr:pilus assembly protein N-terminal domain-containing protein [Caulobacterales bacterium]OJU09700.1 MAG: hypothetical protein BGN86_02335 [Caulobacterales bacterium 68-7]